MIEVGEYVRLKQGFIGKVENINDFREPCMKYAIDINKQDLVFVGEEDIVKNSKNIIDLIEVGDIVHTRDVLEEDYYWMFNEEMIKATRETIESGIELVDILTHEQYEKNTYRLEENK